MKGTWATHLEPSPDSYMSLHKEVKQWCAQCCTSLQHFSFKNHGLRHLELAHVQRCPYETVKTNKPPTHTHTTEKYKLLSGFS